MISRTPAVQGCHCSIHTADPYEDQFEKKATARKEQIAKNEYQRLRNISRAVKSGTVKGDMSSFCSISYVMYCNPQLHCLQLEQKKFEQTRGMMVVFKILFTSFLYQVTQAVGMAHVATASIGKFTEKLVSRECIHSCQLFQNRIQDWSIKCL